MGTLKTIDSETVGFSLALKSQVFSSVFTNQVQEALSEVIHSPQSARSQFEDVEVHKALSHKNISIDVSSLPIQVRDLVSENTITRKESTIEIDVGRDGVVNNPQVERRNATGGRYVDFRQEFSIGGVIGLRRNENQRVTISPQDTNIQIELFIEILDGRRVSGETPPW